MGALIKPYAMGILMAAIALLGLWLAIPMLGSIFGESWFGWYPILLLFPPLILGGYTSARYMRSKYLSRYFTMGGFVGITVMSIIYAITHVEGNGWLSALIITAGGSIAIFGSYLGVLRNRSL